MLNRFYFESEASRLNELAAACPEAARDRLIQQQIENCQSLFVHELEKLGLPLPNDGQMETISNYIINHEFLDLRVPESYFAAYSEFSSRGEFGGLESFAPEAVEAKETPETIRQKISKLPKPPVYGGRKLGDESAEQPTTIVVRNTELPSDEKQRALHGHQENYTEKMGSVFGRQDWTGLTDAAAKKAARESREKRMTPEQKTAIDKGITTHGLPEGVK